MTEADLCLKLEAYFRDYEVYKEVPCYSGRCDLYVKQGVLWTAIEAKKQFSTGLIYQAMRLRPYANYVFVAVPDLKDTYAQRTICKELGIGVIKWSEKASRFEILEQPTLRRKISSLAVLEDMKLATAGVQHNDKSDFKVSLAYMVSYIKRKGGRANIKEMFENNHYHYSHTRSAQQCITRLCREGAIKEFRIEKGDFVLSEIPPPPEPMNLFK